MKNWFDGLKRPLVTRAMLKQAAYWGVTIWLLAVLTSLVHRLSIIVG